MVRKYLNPQNDFAFKKIFGTEKNKAILMTLLNSLIHKESHKELVDVVFLPTNTDPEGGWDKLTGVDVICIDQDGSKYLVAIQVAKDEGHKERLDCYTANAFCDLMQKRDPHEKFKEIIVVTFTNFLLFPEENAYKSEHMPVEKKSHESDLATIMVTFIELPKLLQKELDSMTLEEKLYYFLKHAPEITPEELKKLVGQDTIVTQAFKALNPAYWTAEELQSYETAEKRARA